MSLSYLRGLTVCVPLIFTCIMKAVFQFERAYFMLGYALFLMPKKYTMKKKTSLKPHAICINQICNAVLKEPCSVKLKQIRN